MPALSDPQTISGVITKYKGNGRKLGYPTANLDAETDLTDGVYFGFADMNEYKKHPALIFVGIPVTVGDKTRRVEAHLLDIPDTDYYDAQMSLDVQFFHRANQAFDSIDELLVVMKQDDETGRKWFAETKK